jgi:hypothetical protein
MRWALGLLLVGCTSHAAMTTCPSAQSGGDGDALTGTACTLPGDRTCFVENEFSRCESAWYRCVDGIWAIDHALQPNDGSSCAGSPVSSCSFEGNPDCSTEPTAESCACGGDGVWHCTCACYGSQTSCPLECPSEYPGAGSDGPACTDVGLTCPYSGRLCTCVDTGRFECE